MIDEIPALSFTGTVDRALVHRAAVAEVFVTDSAQLSGNQFLVAAQLPRVHGYYSDHVTSPAAYDPLLLLEVFRQAGIQATHRYMNAPLRSSYIFDGCDLRIHSHSALGIGALPGEVLMRGTIIEEKTRKGVLCGGLMEIDATIGGRPVASVLFDFRWIPSETWRALRSRMRSTLQQEASRAYHTDRRLAPAVVGRRSTENVVLADATVHGREVHAQVVVDQAHPALFDHPLDHIPGAVIFESLRQTSLYTAHELFGLSPRGLAVSRCRTTFSRIGEFELPTDCRAVVLGSSTPNQLDLELSLTQEGDEIASADISLVTTRPLIGYPVPAAEAAALV
ncbi:gamma-butyrolactone biosynthesis protein [Streptomyces sp. NBC_01485]|uniref:ScbA/BarX family gamma-butyrolactone biosynthesis protein n=1 Tax=Streptomyces sp. NBC_01485 TaxID=2903884 RepID=UPI002E31F627|nr:ScbA/BarX family gamma-butyrolactone biosynthesis protein [Streptomyces sp. NBC_01485]